MTKNDLLRLMRPACSGCSNKTLDWMRARDLADLDLTASERVEIGKGLAFFGHDVDAWWCSSCRNWGLFPDVDGSL